MAGRPIDEKIVAMKMDITDFVKKATDTTSMFGKLQTALSKVPNVDMSKVVQSFGNIQSAAQKVDLTPMANSIQQVSSRFGSLEIMAITALANITNKAVNAGVQIGKSLTVQPVMDGFREYETKMKSIGTILANTEWAGSTLDDVKKTLGELNDYADNTIYSFEQMTANVGRFTAAGVTLEDSAIAIKGLGNLAAVSGSDVNQLNTAMYQMSQALAAGKLNLMDWNSLVNAGMAGKKTQDALVATAKAMGKNVDLTDGFRNSIEQGWLTSEVFLETLKKFGTDESMTKAATSVRTFSGMLDALKESVGSGWAETWELIFGDFEVATKRWTALSEVIGGFFKRSSDARNAFVKGLADIGVFQLLFDVITNIGKSILLVTDAIGKGFTNAFKGLNTGATSGLKSIVTGLSKVSAALVPGETLLKAITFLVQALVFPIRIVIEAVVFLGKILIKVLTIPFTLLKLVIDGLSTVAEYIGRMVNKFIESVKSGEALNTMLGWLKKAFTAISDAVESVVRHIKIFGSAVQEAWNIIVKGDFTGVGPWAEDSKIVDKLFNIRKALLIFGSAVQEAWSILIKGDYTGKGPWDEDSKIVDKLFRIREAVIDFVGAVKQAWHILAFGDYKNIGPWAEDSKIVDKLFKIREAVLRFVSGVVEAWNILIYGDFTGKGPWDFNDDVVNNLFKVRKAVKDFVAGVVEAWNILIFGDFTGKGPWEFNDDVVNNLFKVRRAVKDFVSGVVEAWSILVKGDFTGKGPWEFNDDVVNNLFKVRKAVKDFVSGVVESWNILVSGEFTGKGPWDYKDEIVEKLFSIRKSVQEFVSGMVESWSVLTKGIFTGKGPWSEDSAIIKALFKIRDGFKELGEYLKNVEWTYLLAPIALVVKGFQILGEHLASLDFSGVLTSIANGFAKVVDWIGKMNFSLKPVATAFGNFFGAIGKGVEWIVDKFKAVGTAIKNALPSGQQLFAGGFIAGLAAIVALIVKVAWDMYDVFTGWGKIGAGVTEVLESVGNALNAFSAQVYAQALLTIAIAVGILTVALWGLSRLDGESLGRSVYGLVAMLTTMVGAMFALSKFDMTMGPMKIAATMVGMAIGVSLMAGALKKIAEMNPDELGRGILGLVSIMGTLTGAMVLMSKFGGAKVGASALQIVAIAGSMYLLIGAIEKIGGIDTGVLTKGVITLGIVLAELGIFLKLAGGSKFGIGSTLGMLAVGQAVINICDAINEIAKIDVDNLKTGLLTIGIILAEITLFARLTSDKGLFSAGVAMLLISAAITALIIPITILGNMDMGTLAQGLIAMSAALLAIAGAVRLAGSGNMLAAGAGITLIAVALNMLLVPILVFATMGWAALLTGMAGLALSLAIVGGATLLLAPVIPLLGAFGLGILALGAGMTLASGALALFGFGLMTLATLSSGAIATIVATLGTLLVGFASLIPTAVDFVVKLIVQIVNAIAQNAPKLLETIAKLILDLLDVIIKYLPKFIEKGAEILVKFLEGMGKYVPIVIEAALKFMVDLVEGMSKGLREHGPALISAFMELFGEVLIVIITAGAEVINALFGWIPGVTEATSEIGKSAEKTIRDTFGAYGAGEDKGKDFAKALDGKKGDAKKSGENVGKAAKDGTDSADLKSIASAKGKDFADGLQAKASAATTSGKNVAEGGKSGAKSVDMKGAGGDFGSGFASGISGTWSAVYNSAKSLAVSASNAVKKWLDINSPSRVSRKDGGFFGEGLALGIVDKTKAVANSAKGLAITAKDSLNQFLDGFELPNNDNELHFKAVIDYDTLDTSRFGNAGKLTVQPDTSFTNGLVTATKASIRQNGNTSPTSTVDSSTHTTSNHYEVKVEAKGYSTRAEIRKIAEAVTDEIKNINDRTRMGKGEGVVF